MLLDASKLLGLLAYIVFHVPSFVNKMIQNRFLDTYFAFQLFYLFSQLYRCWRIHSFAFTFMQHKNGDACNKKRGRAMPKESGKPKRTRQVVVEEEIDDSEDIEEEEERSEDEEIDDDDSIHEFVIADDAPVERVKEKDTGIDPRNIITGKRRRVTTERYIDPDLPSLYLADVPAEELRAALGTKAVASAAEAAADEDDDDDDDITCEDEEEDEEYDESDEDEDESDEDDEDEEDEDDDEEEDEYTDSDEEDD